MKSIREVIGTSTATHATIGRRSRNPDHVNDPYVSYEDDVE